MKRRIGSAFTAEDRAKLEENSALLQQAVTRQEIAEGNQSYPAISFEEERRVGIRPFDGDNIKKDELLATIGYKGIKMKILSSHSKNIIEFINEPVAIDFYTPDLLSKQVEMKKEALDFLVRSFASSPEMKYHKGNKIELGKSIVMTIEKNFTLHSTGSYRFRSIQTNLSLPLLDQFFDQMRKKFSSTILASDHANSNSIDFFRDTFSYFDKVFDQHFENDRLLNENQRQSMKAVFTQMAWYAIINKVTAYAIKHHSGELKKTLHGFQKNLQPILIRLDNKSIREVVGKFEFFAKAHESKIMDFKISKDIEGLVSKNFKFLFGEGDTMKKALDEIINTFTSVRDLFSFAKEIDVTKLYDSVQYPLTKVMGHDAAVYERRMLGTYNPSEHKRFVELTQKYFPKKKANYTQDDMLNSYSQRKKLQDRKSDKSELRL